MGVKGVRLCDGREKGKTEKGLSVFLLVFFLFFTELSKF